MSTPQTPGPAITSAHIPKTPAAPQVQGAPAEKLPVAEVPQVQLPVSDTLAIVARPLADPDFLGIKPKNPMHQLYWANRGHQNGLRVAYRAAQGFRLARKEDIDPNTWQDFMQDPSGQVVYGDLVCMIIGKNAYQGALLNNHNKSIRRVNKFGQIHQNWVERPDGHGGTEMIPMDRPVDAVRATLDEIRASPQNKNKIRAFVPDASTLDALVGQSSSKPEKP